MFCLTISIKRTNLIVQVSLVHPQITVNTQNLDVLGEFAYLGSTNHLSLQKEYEQFKYINTTKKVIV